MEGTAVTKLLTPKAFMAERKVGLLIRGYATKESDIPSRIAMMDELVAKARIATVAGERFIRRTDLLVWANTTDYPRQADCGKLASALKLHFKGQRDVFVHNIERGDPFCSILNYGIGMQLRAGCDYSVIASSEANAYWDSDIPKRMVEAACKGALAIGVAINELTQSVLQGRLANTLAMYHNMSAVAAGLFDLRASKPKDDKNARYVKGADKDGNAVYYHVGGVEEVILLSRMVDLFGACIAPLQSGLSGLQYAIPSQAENPDLYLHHKQKFGTKEERQMAHLCSINRDFSHLRGGVMPEYREIPTA